MAAARPVYIFIGAWLWVLYKLYQSAGSHHRLNHWLQPADAAHAAIPVSVPLALFLASVVAVAMSKLLKALGLRQQGCLPAQLKHWYVRLALVMVLCGVFFKVVQMAEGELGGSLNGPVSRVVSSGIFAVSRNPVYLCGLITWPVAVSLGADSIVSGLMLFGSMSCYIFLVVIPAEEAYLMNRFRADFVEYAKGTPRWIYMG